jgi:hypothetical protein
MSAQRQGTDRHGELDNLCRAAHEACYRWPATFGGFSATLTLAGPGWRVAGTMVARPPGEVLVDLPGVDQAAWVTRQLCLLVAHRWHRPYELADGRWPKAAGSCSAHPLGTLIRLVGDPHSSSYRVLDGQFSQINREMHGQRLSVLVHQRDPAPDGRSVAVAYTASYWQAATGQLLGSDAHLDRYALVEGILLPERRRVLSAQDGGLVLRELGLRDLTLLPAVGRERLLGASAVAS